MADIWHLQSSKMLLHFLTELGCEIQTMALLRCLKRIHHLNGIFQTFRCFVFLYLIDFLGDEFLKFHCFEIKERVMHAASYTPLEIAVVLWGVLHLYEGNLGKKIRAKAAALAIFPKCSLQDHPKRLRFCCCAVERKTANSFDRFFFLPD